MNSTTCAPSPAAAGRALAADEKARGACRPAWSGHGVWGAALALAFALLLAACGGGHGGSADGASASATIGPAGGALVGPDGAEVVVPPGALAQDTVITIQKAPTGAPALPAGFAAAGPMFALLPHGTVFRLPVTVRLPYDPARVAAGSQAALLKTIAAQTAWQPVAATGAGADRLQAEVSSFSLAIVTTPPIVRGPPSRVYTFTELLTDTLEPVQVDGGIDVGGDLDVKFDWGNAFHDSPIVFLDGTTLPPDGIATGQVASSASGITYYVGAEAPDGQSSTPVGSSTNLFQVQGFVKRAPDAELSITLSAVVIELGDQNDPTRACPTDFIGGDFYCDLVAGEVVLDVRAYTPPDANFAVRSFFHVGGGAYVKGYAGHWSPEAWVDRSTRRQPLWSLDDFDVVTDKVDPSSADATLLRMTLKGPRTYTIDLSSIDVGQSFFLETRAFAEAYSRVHVVPLEGRSSASAFLRDPQRSDGLTIAFSGLDLAGAPLLIPPVELPATPIACPSGPDPDPAAGVIQFSQASYSRRESDDAPVIVVTRSGGSKGEVSVAFATRDQTARAGIDYTPLAETIIFGDGDAVPRHVPLPIVPDTVAGEPNKTVGLELSQPGGCVALGVQSTAQLTIVDDDSPPQAPPAGLFTIGGTVSGLAGSGLLLVDANRALRLPIAANGAFAFAAPLPDRTAYDVRVEVQPDTPTQTCTVANGQGTVNAANVTNIAVSCTAPPATPGLDATFGAGGVVTLGFGNGEALVRQADGKYLLVGGGSSGLALARFNADGSVDTGFGSNGTVTTVIPGSVAGERGRAHAAAVQADGRIVVVGSAAVSLQANGLGNEDFVIARYGADGSLDASFGNGGIVLTDFLGFTDRAQDVVIQPDGRIVVAGQASDSQGVLFGGTGSDFAIARYDTSGQLDTSFGSGGKARTHVAGDVDTAFALARQPDGKLVVAGRVGVGRNIGLDDTGLVRYNADGSLDATFGTNGVVFTTGGGPGADVALQADGKIVLVGNRGNDFQLVRYNADGTLDTAFGSAGSVLTDFNNGNLLFDTGEAVAVQADGKLVAVGTTATSAGSDMAMARYNADGSLDAGFGTGGKLTINISGRKAGAKDVLIQPDGRIVLGGGAGSGAVIGGYALVRVNP